MDKKQQKPVTIAVEELKQKLVEDINSAGLHIALVKPIIQEVNMLISQQYEQTYKAELEQFKKEQENKEPEQYTVPNEEIEDNTPE